MIFVFYYNIYCSNNYTISEKIFQVYCKKKFIDKNQQQMYSINFSQIKIQKIKEVSMMYNVI